MDEETFLNRVAAAVAHLDDRTWLANSPLARLLSPPEGDPGEQLSNILATAIRQLKPRGGERAGAPEWRQYRHLLMRYVLGASPREIAQELNVSDRQARRDHLDGLHALGALLWRQYKQLEQAQTDAGPGLAWMPQAADAEALERDEAMQAEVARMSVAPAAGPTMVEETVRGVLATVARLAAGRGISFDAHFSADPCFVAADHAVLRQILLSLLTFLIESHDNTCIHLTVRDGHDHDKVELRLEVDCLRAAPDGCSPASLDPDDSRLAVCRRLLALQGGSLRMHDDVGGSHGVHLTLPAVWTATVLVIDDNPDFVRLFQRYLGDRAYRVHHANTAEKALRLAREVRPDVITLDVMMPSQDGWEILQALKSHPATQHVPVIVCSVLREEALARSLGAAAFLTKPVRQPALLAALERAATVSTARRG